MINHALNNELDKELKNCLESDVNCKITGEFVREIEAAEKVYNRLDNHFRRTLLDLISSIIQKMNSIHFIEEEIIKPVNECLNNSTIV